MPERISKIDSSLSIEICQNDFLVKSESTFVFVTNEGGVLKIIYKGDVENLLGVVIERMPSFNIFK